MGKIPDGYKDDGFGIIPEEDTGFNFKTDMIDGRPLQKTRIDVGDAIGRTIAKQNNNPLLLAFRQRSEEVVNYVRQRLDGVSWLDSNTNTGEINFFYYGVVMRIQLLDLHYMTINGNRVRIKLLHYGKAGDGNVLWGDYIMPESLFGILFSEIVGQFLEKLETYGDTTSGRVFKVTQGTFNPPITAGKISIIGKENAGKGRIEVHFWDKNGIKKQEENPEYVSPTAVFSPLVLLQQLGMTNI